MNIVKKHKLTIYFLLALTGTYILACITNSAPIIYAYGDISCGFFLLMEMAFFYYISYRYLTPKIFMGMTFIFILFGILLATIEGAHIFILGPVWRTIPLIDWFIIEVIQPKNWLRERVFLLPVPLLWGINSVIYIMAVKKRKTQTFPPL